MSKHEAVLSPDHLPKRVYRGLYGDRYHISKLDLMHPQPSLLRAFIIESPRGFIGMAFADNSVILTRDKAAHSFLRAIKNSPSTDDVSIIYRPPIPERSAGSLIMMALNSDEAMMRRAAHAFCEAWPVESLADELLMECLDKNIPPRGKYMPERTIAEYRMKNNII